MSTFSFCINPCVIPKQLFISCCWISKFITKIYFPETLKCWVGVQQGQSYLMRIRCLFSLGWPWWWLGRVPSFGVPSSTRQCDLKSIKSLAIYLILQRFVQMTSKIHSIRWPLQPWSLTMPQTKTETETEPNDRVIPETVTWDCNPRSRLRLRLCLKFMILQLTPFVE